MLTAVVSPFVPLTVGAFALAMLLYSAIVDARTGFVPPLALALAGFALLVALITTMPGGAGTLIGAAAGIYIAIFLINEVHHVIMGHDALGLGDAHWSFVAVLAYGLETVLWVWGAAAIIALLFLGARKLAGKPAGHVYFVPFLMLALLGLKLAGAA